MASTGKEKYWKYSLGILILLLGWVIIKELWMFVNGLLGAFTIFVMVRRQMIYLTEKKKMNHVLATILILFEVAAVITVPLYFMIRALLGKVQNIDMDISSLQKMIENLEIQLRQRFGYDLFSSENLTTATGYISTVIQYLISQMSSMVVTVVVLIFLLYFILLNFRTIEQYFYELLPFSPENRKNITSEVYVMVRSNAIGIPLLAIIQGLIAYIGYLIFGVPSALLFGFLTCFSTIIPIVGTGIVWVPIVVYLMMVGDWTNAIGLGPFCAIILTNIDNVIRFIPQKKQADRHPLITVFGVIFGLSVFGFWGIIFGPLLLSIFFLLVKMFKTEYLDKGNM